jgi:hypothetical protein
MPVRVRGKGGQKEIEYWIEQKTVQKRKYLYIIVQQAQVQTERDLVI